MRKRMSYPKVQVYPESLAQSAYGDLDIMYNELMTSWVYNNIIGLWYHMGYLFRNGFVCIVRRCKLLNPENIGGYHQINKIGEFLQFSSKCKGIRAWNFRMMIRKIWRFLWYQNPNNFKKNKKRKDQAPLSSCIKMSFNGGALLLTGIQPPSIKLPVFCYIFPFLGSATGSAPVSTPATYIAMQTQQYRSTIMEKNSWHTRCNLSQVSPCSPLK